jgi:hypothetical protein
MRSLLSAFGEAATSGEHCRDVLGIPRPASLRRMFDTNTQPVTLSESLVTSDGVALAGEHSITLRPDGSMKYTGSFRATGFFSYNVSLVTRIIGADGVVAILAANGSVHGTNEAGDRTSAWVQESVSPLLATHWLAFRKAHLEHDLQFDTNFFGTIGEVAAFLGKAVATAATGGTLGVVILLGAEAIDGLGGQEFALPGLVGLAFAGGTLAVFGTGALLPATVVGIAAGAVTAAMVRQRRLTDAEVAFANQVYRGTLPVDRIVLTNLLGVGNRPFTAPVPGNTILVNLGDGFDQPMLYTGDGEGPVNVQAPGQLLIHELCHAWQIGHSAFIPGTMCKGVINQMGTLGGDMSIYQYPDAGPAWGSAAFDLEKQASIVDQWFAGNTSPSGGKQSAYSPMLQDNDGKLVNPYWRYVRDNIRAGIA